MSYSTAPSSSDDRGHFETIQGGDSLHPHLTQPVLTHRNEKFQRWLVGAGLGTSLLMGSQLGFAEDQKADLPVAAEVKKDEPSVPAEATLTARTIVQSVSTTTGAETSPFSNTLYTRFNKKPLLNWSSGKLSLTDDPGLENYVGTVGITTTTLGHSLQLSEGLNFTAGPLTLSTYAAGGFFQFGDQMKDYKFVPQVNASVAATLKFVNKNNTGVYFGPVLNGSYWFPMKGQDTRTDLAARQNGELSLNDSHVQKNQSNVGGVFGVQLGAWDMKADLYRYPADPSKHAWWGSLSVGTTTDLF